MSDDRPPQQQEMPRQPAADQAAQGEPPRHARQRQDQKRPAQEAPQQPAGPAAQHPAQTSAIERREEKKQLPDILRLQGTHDDPTKATAWMAWAQNQRLNLVTPAPAVGMIPEGCGVALSVVKVDARPMDIGGELYSTGGQGEKEKFGLAKSAIDRIGAAAGLSWDPQLSRRLDDGSDPHYCAFRAVGRYRHFDGTEIEIMATKEMDLREGSAQVEALWERYEAAKKKFDAGKQKWPPKSPEGQIREMRLHILSHAETKARLRAIRSLGLKTSYTMADLQQPFVVAKLMWTGQSKDPELRKAFALLTAQKMLGGSAALFGPAPPAPAPAPMPAPPPGTTMAVSFPLASERQIPPPPPTPPGTFAPPPVGQSAFGDRSLERREQSGVEGIEQPYDDGEEPEDDGL